MTTTTNLNLKKPEYSDDADIGDINDNMETIDAAIGALPSGKTVQGQIDEKVSKVTGATNGNIAILDGSGNLLDSGKNLEDVAETAIDDTAGTGDTDLVWSADKSATVVGDLKSAVKDVVYRAEMSVLLQWVPFHCVAGDVVTLKTVDGSNFTAAKFELQRSNGTTDWWTFDSSKNFRNLTIGTGEEFFFVRISAGTAQPIYVINNSSYYNWHGIAATVNESLIDKGLKNGTNVNTVTEPGCYFVSNGTNTPAGYATGYLDVYNYSLDSSTTYAVQRYVSHSAVLEKIKCFERKSSYIQGTVSWSEWTELTYLDKGNKNNQDMDALISPGKYFVTSATHLPTGYSAGFVDVDNFTLDSSNSYAVQKFYSYAGTYKCFTRRSNAFNSGTYTWSSWVELSNDNNIDYGILSAEDLNSVITYGNYYAYNCTNKPAGTNNGLLTVNRFSLDSSTTYVIQNYTDVGSGITYSRSSGYIQNPSFTWKPWKMVTNGGITGKTVVNFGDSIFGNWDDSTSISYNIAKNSGATVYNLGFGGCRMSNYPTNLTLNAFSMCNLIDAIVSGDYSLQEEKAPSGPDYFVSRVQRLESIDFTKVDIITIAYGCNDVTDTVLVDNPENPFDRDTYCGALRYTLKKFGENFPQIKIVVLPPIFEVYLSDGQYAYDSDALDYGERRGFTIPPTDRTFIDYVEGAMNVAKEYHTLTFDEYYENGFNKYNYATFYADGTHLNETGRKRRGERLAAKLSSVF